MGKFPAAHHWARRALIGHELFPPKTSYHSGSSLPKRPENDSLSANDKEMVLVVMRRRRAGRLALEMPSTRKRRHASYR